MTTNKIAKRFGISIFLGRSSMRLIVASMAISTAAYAEGPGATPPAEENFLSKLAGAVKKGVEDGVDNGVQSAGSVKVLGYTMLYSKLKGSNQPAYCLENADTGKLITVSPMFGSPYRRADGTIGFAAMAVPVDKYHNKVEVNLQGVLPGFTCADLIAKKGLTPYTALAGASSASAAQGGVAHEKIIGCVGYFLAKKPDEPYHYALCHNRAMEPYTRVAVETGGGEPLRPGDKYKTGIIRTIKIDMASWNEYNDFVLHKGGNKE